MLSDDSLFKIYLLAADGAYVNQDSHKAGLRAVAEAAVKDAVGGEPVAWMYTDRFGTHFTDEKDEWEIAEGIESVQPLYARPQASTAVPECPFPCGWQNLLTLMMKDAAWVIRVLQAYPDEPLPEHLPQTVFVNQDRALRVVRAMLAASQPEVRNV